VEIVGSNPIGGAIMSYGVIGNTSGFGPEESRFEPLWDNNLLMHLGGKQSVRFGNVGIAGAEISYRKVRFFYALVNKKK
jgi:hypothetical protein